MVNTTHTLERIEGTGADCWNWELPETGSSIWLSLEVVDRLEREALESFRAITKRGSEIGGLLLGQVSRDPHAIKITDYEPVACDYSRGPLYQLSEEDERRLEAAIARPGESLSVVGFFRSNTRKELALDANDVAVIEKYFPGRDSLVLLVKPFSMKPSLGGFFLREHGQTSPSIEFAFRRSELGKNRPGPERIVVKPEPSDDARIPARVEQAALPAFSAGPEDLAGHAPREDRVAVDLRALDKAMATPTVAEPAKPEAASVPTEAVATPAPAPVEDAASAPPASSRRWLWLPLLAAALGAGAYFGYRLNGPLLLVPQPPGGSLSLSVERHAGQLSLGWNRSAPVIARAQRATLSITDGAQEQNLVLDLGQLRTGSLVYTPSTGDVVFRLEVADLRGGKTVTESIRAVAGRPSPLGPLPLQLPELAPAQAASEPTPEAETPAASPQPSPTGQSADGPPPAAPTAPPEPALPPEATPPQ